MNIKEDRRLETLDVKMSRCVEYVPCRILLMADMLTMQTERTEKTRPDAEAKGEKKVRLSQLTSISGARPESSDDSPQRKRKHK